MLARAAVAGLFGAVHRGPPLCPLCRPDRALSGQVPLGTIDDSRRRGAA